MAAPLIVLSQLITDSIWPSSIFCASLAFDLRVIPSIPIALVRSKILMNTHHVLTSKTWSSLSSAWVALAVWNSWISVLTSWIYVRTYCMTWRCSSSCSSGSEYRLISPKSLVSSSKVISRTKIDIELALNGLENESHTKTLETKDISFSNGKLCAFGFETL